MKILLVDPHGKNKGLNTGLGYLSAVLKDRHTIEVLDLNNIEMGFCGDPNPDIPFAKLAKRVESAVDRFEPDIFGVSVKTFTADVSREIFRSVRSMRPKLATIAGGPHITLDGHTYISENSIDFGVQGEGEHATSALCDVLDENGEISGIDGLFYWRNNQLICNGRDKSMAKLEDLPFPVYDHFSSVIGNGGCLNEYPLLSSRGCPFHCSFCSMPHIMGSAWRSNTPARVIQELQHAKQKYHSSSFTVIDDNFTLNLKRVEEICARLISEQLNLTWSSQNGIRADRISPDLAKKMRRSGCKYVWIGIESADETVFKTINKGEELVNIEKGIGHLKEAGIHVGGFFIVGLPHSTREADLKSVEFVRRHGIEGWWFNFVPYPHTAAWEWVQTHAKVLRSADGALQYGVSDIEPVFETDDYTRAERMRTYDEIHVRAGHFDRLVDPSLKLWERWKQVFQKVGPYDPPTVFSCFLFFLKSNVQIAIRKVLGQ